MKIRNIIISKIKSFNKNKLIALFLSSLIIIYMRYHIDNLGYVSYFSLLFIFSCTLLKSIIMVIVENISKIKKNKVLFKDKNFFNKN